MLHSGTDALRNLPGASTTTRSALLNVLAQHVFARFIGGVESVRRRAFDRDAFQTAWIQFQQLVNLSNGAIATRFEDSDKFAHWFLKVLKSRFLDAERKRKRRRATSLTTLADEPTTDGASAEEACRDVAKWFSDWFDAAGLDKDERECILLRFIEGLKASAIAEETHAPAPSVYRKIEYAKRKLRKIPRPELD